MIETFCSIHLTSKVWEEVQAFLTLTKKSKQTFGLSYLETSISWLVMTSPTFQYNS